MRCLVVGGNGFVGSSVVDQLHRLGNDVGVYDRFSTGFNRFESSGIRVHRGDFLDSQALRAVVRGYDTVYHLVTTTTPATADADPLLDIRTNVMGSVELLQACADAGVARFYFASSGGTIYGSVADRPAREEDPTVPVSPYGIGKLATERYLDFYRTTTEMETVSFRVSNAYGPRQDPFRPQGVIPIFLRAARDGRPVKVLGDGTMARDYIFAEDVARAIVAPLVSPHRHSVYNIGSGEATTVNEIIDLVSKVTDRQLAVEHAVAPSTFVQSIVLDTSRYRAAFGEMVHVDLLEGISRTWKAITEA